VPFVPFVVKKTPNRVSWLSCPKNPFNPQKFLKSAIFTHALFTNGIRLDTHALRKTLASTLLSKR
jgi:hypothetical protein